MSVLDHPLITQRYFFPRRHAVADPTWVDVEQGRLACYASRSGHPLTVVHFHGNGEVVDDYVPDFVEMIDELGADCFLAEYRGYGASGGVPQLGKMLDDVEAIFEAVGRRPEEIIVFGRSLGSIYAIELAHRHPDVAGLVLESAIADPMERILMRMTPAELGISLSAIEAEFRERLDHLAKLRARRKPTLIMHTKHDHLVDASHAVRLSSGPAENVRLVLLPRGDHNTIFPANRERYVDELRGLIELCARGETRYEPTGPAAGSPEALLQRYFDAFARHALPEMLELLHEDVQAFYPAEPHRDWKGKKSAEASLSNYFKTFPDLRVDWHIESIEPVPGQEDAVAVTMRNRLLATVLERPVHVKYVLAGGKIRAFHHL